ncbi:MAG: EMC3/TMCO1 family protein [Candidatus Woesearchaeota archaeon]
MITANAVLNPIFSPLINLSPAIVIAIFGALISIITTIIYKYTTPQKELKNLREESSKLQKRIKELQKKVNDPEAQKEMMKLNSQILALSGKQLRYTMNSTLITFIPLILIFSWINANYAYQPLMPNQDFNITFYFKELPKNDSLEIYPEGTSIVNKTIDFSKNTITYTLKGIDGSYLLTLNYDDEKKDKEIIITEKQKYEKPVENYPKENLKKIVVSNKPLRIKILGISMSWIWYYIIIALITSTLFRKFFKVY